VSRTETGGQLPTEDEAARWAAAAGADPAELLALRDRAAAEYATFRKRSELAGGWAEYEDAITAADFAARRIGHYQPAIIPDYLQTRDYARAVLHLADGPAAHGASDDDIQRKLAARLRRQSIIDMPGRQITLLVGEGGLRQRVAGPEVMAGQCRHIARLAESLTTATIGIIPFTARMPVYGMTGWTAIDDLVQIETEGGDVEIADPAEVERYWRYLKLLEDVALTGTGAAALCYRIAEEHA
jgi:hypothetical protein